MNRVQIASFFRFFYYSRFIFIGSLAFEGWSSLTCRTYFSRVYLMRSCASYSNFWLPQRLLREYILWRGNSESDNELNRITYTVPASDQKIRQKYELHFSELPCTSSYWADQMINHMYSQNGLSLSGSSDFSLSTLCSKLVTHWVSVSIWFTQLLNNIKCILKYSFNHQLVLIRRKSKRRRIKINQLIRIATFYDLNFDIFSS